MDIDGTLTENWQKSVYEYCTNNISNYEEHEKEFWNTYDTKYSETFRKNMASIPIFYSSGAPTKSLIGALWELSTRHSIAYGTVRPKEVELTTYNWLKRYNFPNYTELYLGDKTITARRLGTDLAIDDHIKWALRLMKMTSVILITRPYNIDSDIKVPRINAIEELLDLI
jgi:uncharacterized HAD superfamily protein